MNTGIFFYYQQGERLRDFPQALEDILIKDNVFLYDAHYPSKPASSFDLSPIPLAALQRVHSEDMIRRVMETGAYEGALYSASGTFEAAVRICSGELTNAFVFTGYGDHHAGSAFFGGGCYFNGAAIAIRELKERYGMTRFAIVDTDAHHGDGTWEIFGNDPHVLYICLCGDASYEENSNINIRVPRKIDDHAYIQLAGDVFEKRLAGHRPEMIFWNWGYDGTQGDYGDIGLTRSAHLEMARLLKRWAERVCGGRLLVVLCGGHRRDLAAAIIPGLIGILANP